MLLLRAHLVLWIAPRYVYWRSYLITFKSEEIYFSLTLWSLEYFSFEFYSDIIISKTQKEWQCVAIMSLEQNFQLLATFDNLTTWQLDNFSNCQIVISKLLKPQKCHTVWPTSFQFGLLLFLWHFSLYLSFERKLSVRFLL